MFLYRDISLVETLVNLDFSCSRHSEVLNCPAHSTALLFSHTLLSASKFYHLREETLNGCRSSVHDALARGGVAACTPGYGT